MKKIKTYIIKLDQIDNIINLDDLTLYYTIINQNKTLSLTNSDLDIISKGLNKDELFLKLFLKNNEYAELNKLSICIIKIPALNMDAFIVFDNIINGKVFLIHNFDLKEEYDMAEFMIIIKNLASKISINNNLLGA